MTQSFAELLLLVPAALTTGFVMFVAGVLQSIMNDLDETAFKSFLHTLYTHALKSPYAIAVSSITFVGMIPYFIFYGFGNLWFTAGLAMWVIASIVSKMTALPIYAKVDEIDNNDTEQLRLQRQKLQTANILRSSLSFVSIILMVAAFF